MQGLEGINARKGYISEVLHDLQLGDEVSEGEGGIGSRPLKARAYGGDLGRIYHTVLNNAADTVTFCHNAVDQLWFYLHNPIHNTIMGEQCGGV